MINASLVTKMRYMNGRPLVNGELYEPLISHNYGRNSELKHRNKLLLLMAGLLGLREIELTLVTVDLFVSPTGELKEFVVLPESVTRDGYERPIVIAHDELKKAFESYLSWLITSGINTTPTKHYLGLNPNSQLFVNDDFKPFTVQSRGENNLNPHAMNRLLDRLIKNADLWDKGVRRLSLIRTSVIEAYRAGMSTTDISITTSLSDDTIGKILAMDYGAYSPITDWFINRRETKQRRLESFKKRRKYQL